MDFNVCYDGAGYQRLFIKSPPAPLVTPAPIIKGVQAAEHVKVHGTWDTATDAALQVVRSAAYLNERPNVRALQTAVGTTPDGRLGPSPGRRIDDDCRGCATGPRQWARR